MIAFVAASLSVMTHTAVRVEPAAQDYLRMRGRQVRTGVRAVDRAPVPEAALQPANEHEPEAHEQCPDEQHGPAAPLVDVDDGGDYRPEPCASRNARQRAHTQVKGIAHAPVSTTFSTYWIESAIRFPRRPVRPAPSKT